MAAIKVLIADDQRLMREGLATLLALADDIEIVAQAGDGAEAIEFLRRFNTELFGHYSEATTLAEESTAWPMVSRPVDVGGLGFGFKWDMGFMHDTLSYFAHDPVHRKYHHNELTFRGVYYSSENFVLPFSHDEVICR